MKIFISILSILFLSFSSCQKGDLPEHSVKTEVTPNIQTLDETKLVNLIKTFSIDVGADGQKAFDQLRSFDRSRLIGDLLRLRDSLPSTDSLQPQIAFAFCHLDHEYKANAEIVASALSKNPKYQNFYGDQAASMVARLIRRGDKSLLSALFSSVRWADGALAAELGVDFAYELVNDTKAFLEILGNQPKDTRLKVYQLIHSSNELSAEDQKIVKNYLSKVNSESRSYGVAREILASDIFK